MWTIETGPRITEWCADQLNIGIYGPHQSFGIVEDGKIVGACVFHEWNRFDISVAVANTKRAWPRPFLRRLGQYAFDELKCVRATAVTRSDNRRAIRALSHFATLEGTRRRGFGDADALIFGVLKEEWPYA